MPKLYPRLEDFEYEDKIKYVENILTQGEYSYTPKESNLSWLPIGERVSIDELKKLRNNIVIFTRNNISFTSLSYELTDFDRKLGLKLLEWLDITPSIAADTGMWAYLDIVLIPDVIKVRWGYDDKGHSKDINHQRYYDTRRAYLKKTWFTAYILNDPVLLANLKQDQIDNWYDKTNSRGYSNYLNQVYSIFNDLISDNNINSNLRDYFREYIRTVNRKLAYINYYALSEDNFRKLASQAFIESLDKKGCVLDQNIHTKNSNLTFEKKDNSQKNKPSSVTAKANTQSSITSIPTQSIPTRGWSLDLFNCIKKIPTKEFTLAQVYDFIPYFQKKYPKNTAIEASIRKLLQKFRDDYNLLEFYGNGCYKKLF